MLLVGLVTAAFATIEGIELLHASPKSETRPPAAASAEAMMHASHGEPMHSRAARWPFLLPVAVAAITIVFALGFYDGKQVRVKGTSDIAGATCWLNKDEPSMTTPLCCPGTGPCYLFQDVFHQLFCSLNGSLAIPLICWVLHVNTAALNFRKQDYARLLLIVAVLMFRMLVLYLSFEKIESWIAGPEPKTCWYSSYRRGNKCKETFDHADHVVLYMVNFMATASIELAAAFSRHPGRAPFKLGQRMLLGWCALLYCCVAYCMFFTAKYFHSPAETLVAWTIASVIVCFPMWHLAGSNIGNMFC